MRTPRQGNEGQGNERGEGMKPKAAWMTCHGDADNREKSENDWASCFTGRRNHRMLVFSVLSVPPCFFFFSPE